MSNQPFKPEKEHNSNQTHQLCLQNDSPFSGLVCCHSKTYWVEPPFLSSLYYLQSQAWVFVFGLSLLFTKALAWFLLAPSKDHYIHFLHCHCVEILMGIARYGYQGLMELTYAPSPSVWFFIKPKISEKSLFNPP